MNQLWAIALFLVMWWCVFQMQRFGSLDPHHVEATPGRWSTLLKSALTILAIALVPIFSEYQPGWVAFCAMFALAQTVAVAFTWPDRFRPDEQTGKIRNLRAALRSSSAGATIAKFLSIGLSWLLSGLIGQLWFFVLMGFGFLMMMSKGFLTLTLIQADDGEFSTLTEKERIQKMDEWSPVVARGQFGYLVGCSAFGYAVYEFAQLEPSNWLGWAGLALGALVNALLSVGQLWRSPD